jgi:CrcB protein
MKIIFTVALGGGIGSMLRYLLQRAVADTTTAQFPFGTFVVNLTGCLLIGLFWGMADRGSALNENWKLFLITGLCGGFTTFSAYSQDAINLLREGRFNFFFLYAGGTLVAGLLLTWLGYLLTK